MEKSPYSSMLEEMRKWFNNLLPLWANQQKLGDWTRNWVQAWNRGPSNCQTRNCIYYLICRKANCKEYPKCEYIGLTTRPFRNRLAEHKQYVKSRILDTPAGNHFNLPGHNLSHLAGLVLEEVKSSDPFVLRAREFLYIQKFDTYKNGLNKEV